MIVGERNNNKLKYMHTRLRGGSKCSGDAIRQAGKGFCSTGLKLKISILTEEGTFE